MVLDKLAVKNSSEGIINVCSLAIFVRKFEFEPKYVNI